jgi:hypothetical protein
VSWETYRPASRLPSPVPLAIDPVMAVFVPDKLQHSQSIEQFLKEIEDDFGAPGNSKFQDYIPKSRKNLHAMEESLAGDKTHIHKLSGALKELSRAGEQHGQCMGTLADHLVRFGTHVNQTDPTIGNSFVKFGTLMNQMSSLLSNMATSTRNIIFYSLSMLFDNEMKGNKYKSDIKSLTGQYQSAKDKVEKEERKTLASAGCNVTERVFSAEELSGKLITERRRFQLGVCEYMLRFNDVKTKEGVDLAEHLVAYYHAQDTYFREGGMVLAALKNWEARFNSQISQVRPYPTHLISHDCHMTPDASDAGRREEETAVSEGTSAGGSGDRDQDPCPRSPGPQCQYRSDGEGGLPGEEAREPSETGSQGVAQEILHRQHAGVHYGAEPQPRPPREDSSHPFPVQGGGACGGQTILLQTHHTDQDICI